MDKVYLGTWASVIDEKKNIWFSNFNFNGLFKYDYSSDQMFFISRFENAEINEVLLHSAAYYVNGKIVFIPSECSDYLCIFDTVIEAVEYLRLPERVRTGWSTEVGSKIYMGTINNHILSFDKGTFNIKIEDSLSEQFSNKVDGKSDDIIRFNNGYIFIINGNSVFQINVDSREEKKLIIDEKYNNITNFFLGEGKYWIVRDKTSDIVEWDIIGNRYIDYKLFDGEWLADEHIAPYSGVMFVNGRIILPGYYLKGIYEVNRDERKIENMFSFPDDFQVIEGVGYGALYKSIHFEGNICVFVPQRGSKLLVVKEKNIIVSRDFCIDKECIPYYKEYRTKTLEKNNFLLLEGKNNFSLDEFISHLTIDA